MAVSAGRKARLKAAAARNKRMSLVKRADPNQVYLLDTSWKDATLHYIETGVVTGGMPFQILDVVRASEEAS